MKGALQLRERLESGDSSTSKVVTASRRPTYVSNCCIVVANHYVVPCSSSDVVALSTCAGVVEDKVVTHVILVLL